MLEQLGLVTSNVIAIYICSEECNLMKINSGVVITCTSKLYKLGLIIYVYW